MLKNSFKILGLLLTANFLYGQNIGVDFLNQTGGKKFDYAVDVATDSEGNIITMGVFIDSVDLDPGTNKQLVYSKNNSMYLQKTDTDGKLIWIKTISSTVSHILIYRLDVDIDNNILVAGAFRAKTDFNPGTDSFFVEPNGSTNGFVLKLNNDGEFTWVYTCGSGLGTYARTVDTDSEGNVYLSGDFELAFDADNGEGETKLTPVGESDVYIIKLNSAGEFQWATSFGGDKHDDVGEVLVDNSDNVLVAGGFESTVDFDPGVGETKFTSNGRTDAFVSKFNKDGNLLWAQAIGGSSSDFGLCLANGNNGNVYMGGYFYDSVDFNPGSGTHFLKSNGSDDIFILKLDAAGSYNWAKSVGGTFRDRAICLDTDEQENAYLSGFFSRDVDFNPNDGVDTVKSKGYDDIFVQKLDKDGEYEWTFTFGGVKREFLYGAHYDGNTMILAGSFEDTITLADNRQFISKGFADGIVFKLKDKSVGLPKDQQKMSVALYPNPNQGNFLLRLNKLQENVSISIYQVNGKLISKATYQNQREIPLQIQSESGMYLVQVETKEGVEQVLVSIQ
ncbi:MAG: T9SS type A sorting domain-containing protein [Bacteroidetes bacterium]|nr:T9SS type A sorting domain-containing protein [Bacteroidota bacterium]